MVERSALCRRIPQEFAVRLQIPFVLCYQRCQCACHAKIIRNSQINAVFSCQKMNVALHSSKEAKEAPVKCMPVYLSVRFSEISLPLLSNPRFYAYFRAQISCMGCCTIQDVAFRQPLICKKIKNHRVHNFIIQQSTWMQDCRKSFYYCASGFSWREDATTPAPPFEVKCSNSTVRVLTYPCSFCYTPIVRILKSLSRVASVDAKWQVTLQRDRGSKSTLRYSTLRQSVM